jgi:tRNA threonylcarbamoyladenosine biosynthesis protein TsaE
VSGSSWSRRELVLPTPEATTRLGACLGGRLRAGQGLALVGELGAGKTCLARGVAAGLAVDDPGAVASPTYLLLIEHPGPTPMLHVDAYFPEKTRAFLLDGGLDYAGEVGGVIVVEWADRLPDLLPTDTLWVELRPHGADADQRLAILRGRAGVFRWIETIDDGVPGA